MSQLNQGPVKSPKSGNEFDVAIRQLEKLNSWDLGTGFFTETSKQLKEFGFSSSMQYYSTTRYADPPSQNSETFLTDLHRASHNGSNQTENELMSYAHVAYTINSSSSSYPKPNSINGGMGGVLGSLPTINTSFSEDKKPPSVQENQSPGFHYGQTNTRWSSDELNFLDPLLINDKSNVNRTHSRSLSTAFSIVPDSTEAAQENSPIIFAKKTDCVPQEFTYNLQAGSIQEKNALLNSNYHGNSSYSSSSCGNTYTLSNYSRIDSDRVDELRENLNLLPAFSYPHSTAEFISNRRSEISSSTYNDSKKSIWSYERDDPSTPSPLKYHNQPLTIPSSPVTTGAISHDATESLSTQKKEPVGQTVSENVSYPPHLKPQSENEPVSTQAASNRVRKYVKKDKKHPQLMIYPIKFKFRKRKEDYQCYANQCAEWDNFRNTASTSLRCSSVIKNTESSGLSDIYDIGPKVLPKPFTKEFHDLKYHKFVPLGQLKRLPAFQLPHGQESNYVADKPSRRTHFPKRPASGSDLGAFRLQPSKQLGDVQYDRYYSRLNIYELSRILELHLYDIALTKQVEIRILEIFGNYCDFRLGHQTWIRDTDKEKRKSLIRQLYSYSSVFYPEIDPFKLEVIIRRGSYSLMQSRLRRERRSKTAKR
ncbi:hypothetical protein KGF56_004204 [Candida oxycetoniae]|uniref:Uncharacterized protein n=1 Tax=Candida oxycetoniae TaxID=497107 RepID=A0AAI9SU72_9ASCO|nr:uncharacterized protein KGF56_004204 [Candida oxycetoniae]KAI3402951.2 hypothetical protein KGF56_004204 [Candida oxycetoniae]